MSFYFSEASHQNLIGVDRRLINICELAIKYTTVDFGIPSTGGLRTAAEQYQLFLQGKSSRDGIKKKSKHQSGLAVDVFAWVDGKVSYKMEHLEQIALAFFRAAQELGHPIKWGGFWRPRKDGPHFELI